MIPAVGIHRAKSTPRQEWVGRTALVALGLLTCAVATALGWFSVKMIFALGEAGAAEAVRFGWPLLVLAGFLGLLAATAIALAFLPPENGGPRPPRGFIGVSRLFDGFWGAIRKITQGL
jgi:hypothetical protein